MSGQIVGSLRPYTLGFTVFQAVLLLLQQNGEYEVAHILAYLPRLDIVMKLNGKPGRVPKLYGPFSGGDLISAPIDANAIAELYSPICYL
jgi:hypothetical protein